MSWWRERLERAVELLDDEVEPAERAFLELLQLLLEVRAARARFPDVRRDVR